MSVRSAQGIAVVCSLLAVGAPPLFAAPTSSPGQLPARPEKLAYPPLHFEVPRAEGLRHELPGGVVVYVVPDHALPLVNVVLDVRAGAYREPADKPGLAGLTATLMRVGGTTSLTPEDFDEKADFLAANLDAEGGDVTSSASLNVLTSGLGEGLDLLFDMVRHPRFDAARLDVEKAKRLEAMKQRNDDADSILGREWGWLLYGRDAFLARESTAAELQSITRDDLEAFHRRTWGPEGMVIAVSGDVEPGQILPELEKRLAGWKATEPAPWPPTLPSFTPKPGLYQVEKDIPQGKVRLGHRSLEVADWSNPDLYALQVMNDILGGGGFTARLTKRVRSDEGLAYGAYSVYSLGQFWPRTFAAAYASKNPTVAYALQITLDEIAKIRESKVSDEELRTSKASFVDTFPRHFESAAKIAGTFANDEIVGRPHSYWYDYRKRIEAVTADDVLRVAKEHLHPDDLVILIVGKWSEIAPGDPQGRAKMSQFDDGQVTHLPLLDPLTLEPLPPAK